MTALAHAEALKADIEAEGFSVTRTLATDGGFAFQLLIAAKEADVQDIAAICASSPYVVAKDWQPAWLPLRKCVVVTCANPGAE